MSHNNSTNFLSSELFLTAFITNSLLSCLRFALVLLKAIFHDLAKNRICVAQFLYGSVL